MNTSSGQLSSADLTSGTSSLHEKTDGIQIFTWDGPDDKRCPRNWSEKRKWLISSISLIGTFILPLNGTGITIAADELAAEFNVVDSAWFTQTYWIVTSWSAGGALFVIFCMPLLEELGVRRTYLLFYIFFILMVIPQAVAQNYETLIITRFFSGGCAAFLANAISSIIPDLWATDKKRSVPVAIYILLYVVGNSFGPTIFAAVIPATGNWRWVFYIQLIVYCAFLPVFAFGVKETRHDILLQRYAKQMRKETGLQIYAFSELDRTPAWKRILKAQMRPLYLLFTEPLLFFCTLWSAFAFGNVFVFTQSVEFVFSQVYGFDQAQCGYLQSAIVIGEIFGFLANLYNIRPYLESAKRNKEHPGEPIPEARLYVAIVGTFVGIVGGMLVYAWATFAGGPWIAPAIGLGLVGFGIQVVVAAAADYIIDAYAISGWAGSAISAAAACENLSAGFLPLSTQAMYTRLGVHWATTLLAGIALLVGLAPVVFLYCGGKMRGSSKCNRKGREELKQDEEKN
ncbi:hypothetical protein M409DRAFT_24657 [Zasmidium cellare ATCC 36951]|uniref:Major facilitator superfamily (MFS) profile domain-containing protein n=1 Tax=Zasmidium cellare ATCC 36951 TaxID=1080233 RepID=A0A6A6CDW0_ZASCE|nr:uncharacterized protein M409DRAFT_24657 [Zasmidium cellare ATCC 36951]KAF2165275.1 hypothetical protein M409DRAFT_24657 [Zasmidium cellare ATCC 36951]